MASPSESAIAWRFPRRVHSQVCRDAHPQVCTCTALHTAHRTPEVCAHTQVCKNLHTRCAVCAHGATVRHLHSSRCARCTLTCAKSCTVHRCAHRTPRSVHAHYAHTCACTPKCACTGVRTVVHAHLRCAPLTRCARTVHTHVWAGWGFGGDCHTFWTIV